MCIDPLLSVIVPVYNVEPYLAKCLDSLLSQDISDYEVILVDDGSTDNSSTNNTKKAIVTLKSGDKIDFYSNI